MGSFFSIFGPFSFFGNPQKSLTNHPNIKKIGFTHNGRRNETMCVLKAELTAFQGQILVRKSVGTSVLSIATVH